MCTHWYKQYGCGCWEDIGVAGCPQKAATGKICKTVDEKVQDVSSSKCVKHS